MSIKELEAQALKLAPADQARLLHKLAQALDQIEPELTNSELAKRWNDFESSGEKGTEANILHHRAQRRYGLA
jgi:hypothetical protein